MAESIKFDDNVQITYIREEEEEKSNVVEEIKDDNVLVKKRGIKETDVVAVTRTNWGWNDPSKLEKLRNEVKLLQKTKKPHKIPEDVLIKAISLVLEELGWIDDQDDGNGGGITAHQKMTVDTRNIINNSRNKPSFSKLTTDKNSKTLDFWLIKVFVKTNDEDFVCEGHGHTYKKKDVLMSNEFCTSFKNYCKSKLQDQVQFWCFSSDSSGKKQLLADKIEKNEWKTLEEKHKDKNIRNNIGDFVMIQFKKKIPEVMVGKVLKREQ